MGRFWGQENKAYRDMQVVLTILALNFLIPSISYLFAPSTALEQFLRVGRLLGGADYPVTEQSHIWRVLAFSDVFTLGFACVWIQLDVRRNAPAIPVFAVLKGVGALGFLWVWMFELRYPLFLAAFALDSVSATALVFFCRRALRSLEASKTPSDALVPRPLWS
jgi:hypothetical protein